LWVDNHGEMDIINHTTDDKCHLKFIPYSYFSRDVPRKVSTSQPSHFRIFVVVVTRDGLLISAVSGRNLNKTSFFSPIFKK
jgi:hypothetical protein